MSRNVGGMKRNVVLFGFMGTGKTSVGRILAGRLGMKFLDMDSIIEEREGRPITRIFAENGEAYFRKLERALVKELSACPGLVIATGGGVVLDHDNVRDYSETGLAVCLSAGPETILARVGGDSSRPLLAVDDKIGKIKSLLEQRREYYAAVPVQVDTTGKTVGQVVEQILSIYHGA